MIPLLKVNRPGTHTDNCKQTVQKMTPVATKKAVAPQPKKVEPNQHQKLNQYKLQTLQTKPAESVAKKGIDAALDGLE